MRDSNASHLMEHQAAALASRLPPLLLEAERIAASVNPGTHGRRRVGMGESFWQFRRYQPGDPADRIDWRQSAKTDHLYLRETEWEAAQTLYVWADASASMDYQSTPNFPTKASRAQLLAASLACLALRGGERVALLEPGAKPHYGHTALHRVVTQLMRQKPDNLPRLASMPRYAACVLFSDFFAPIDDWHERIRRLAAGGMRGHLVQIFYPAECSFPFTGRTYVNGMEDESALLVPRMEALREAYQVRLKQLQDVLAVLARAAGWRFSVHVTDKQPQIIINHLFTLLEQTRRKS